VVWWIARFRCRLRHLPNSGDSSATPLSSSVAVVHLWPKVSTPSRSSRRFLPVLPFNLQFRGHSHLILFAFSFFSCTVRAEGRRPPPPVEIRPPPPVPTVGEHTSEIPSAFSFCSEPRPSPWPPPPPATGTARSTCTLQSLTN
jgi:hypothetical protein